MSRTGFILIILICFRGLAFSQDIFNEKIISFEEKSLAGWSSTGGESSVSRTDLLYKHGTHALQWNWKKGDSLVLKKNIGFQPADASGKDTYLSTFVVWVYNEIPLDDHVIFQFGKGTRRDCSFDFNMNFKGWRAAWVCFERDMQGTPQKDMDQMTIIAPEKAEKGMLCLDHIILSVLSDSRYQTPDFQVPFVNQGTSSHWLTLHKYACTQPDIQAAQTISQPERQDISILESRLKNHFCKSKKQIDGASVSELQSAVDNYHIRITGGKVSGAPLWFIRATEVYERFADNWYQFYANTDKSLDNYFDLMLKVACAYHQADKEDYRQRLKDMFLKLYAHAEEQGIAYGSGLGTIHHSGYSFRSYYPALFLMKDVLQESGHLSSAVKAMQWYAATGEVFVKPDKPGMDMDAFNTTAPGRLASILMMDDTPEKVVCLRSFVRWADNGLLPSEGLMGAFKSDGAVIHHCNNYPAYGVGGIGGASLLTCLFSGTDFRLSESGHGNLKNAMQTMRFYCNTKEWPVSISGRHPRGTEKLNPECYAWMALAGSPDGKQKIDEEMARTYLRLTQFDEKTSEYRKQFLKLGLQPEEIPQGNQTIAYGCLNVHRRGQWMAAAHGFSRYLWAAEHYVGANYYGRYLSHGSLFIQTGLPNHLVTNASSGYQQTGWNWNAIPGTTTIHLPLELLKANILNVDTCSGYEEMLHSDEAFAGGLSQEGKNGIFAMKLHEHDKYNGSLRARKSYFFFDNMIVCLGSGIENTVAKYPTRTTLYQTALNNMAEPTWKDEKMMKSQDEFSFVSSGNILMNNVRIGYYLPDGQSVTLTRKLQSSRDQASDKPTEGLFASAWIEHGKAPSGGSYEYAVFPESTLEAMKDVKNRMKKKETALYEVLQKDNKAHIVRDNTTQTTAFALFEPDQVFKGQTIEKVDSACLVMLKEAPGKLILTVADPDLRLYEGPSDDIYDAAGKRIERSIYSRSWIANQSIPSLITVTLKGVWKLDDSKYCTVKYIDNSTVLSFTCQDGMGREVTLKQ